MTFLSLLTCHARLLNCSIRASENVDFRNRARSLGTFSEQALLHAQFIEKLLYYIQTLRGENEERALSGVIDASLGLARLLTPIRRPGMVLSVEKVQEEIVLQHLSDLGAQLPSRSFKEETVWIRGATTYEEASASALWRISRKSTFSSNFPSSPTPSLSVHWAAQSTRST